MLVASKEIQQDEEMPEETKRVVADLLKTATTPMITMAEKGFRLKLIDNLYKVGYYKYKQSAYVIET